MQVLQGDQDLTRVKFHFVLIKARIGHALEKLVKLGAGAVSEDKELSGQVMRVAGTRLRTP